MIKIRLLLLCSLVSSIAFGGEVLTKLKGKDIYGCFSEVKTSKYKSTTLILRNNKTISNDFIINEKENKDSVLIINSYNDGFKESFEVSPLKFEGKESFVDSKDGWSPKLHDKTFFTARGNLKAFSIQSSNGDLITANYSEFASRGTPLVCTSDKKVIKALFFKLIAND